MGQSIPQRPLDTATGAHGATAQPLRGALYAARKVPEVTIFFWIIKLLSTALGESTSDYLVFHTDPYLTVALGGVGLVVALALQFFARRYVAWIYWLAVVMVAIFGTMAADVVHIVLGVPYLNSTIFFAGCLAVIFGAWYVTEKTLSIHSITTPRRVSTSACSTAFRNSRTFPYHGRRCSSAMVSSARAADAFPNFDAK